MHCGVPAPGIGAVGEAIKGNTAKAIRGEGASPRTVNEALHMTHSVTRNIEMANATTIA